MIPVLSHIRIYPVKSLDPVELPQAEIGSYSLRYDREFAMLTNDNQLINGKRTGRVSELKAEYEIEKHLITLGPRTGGSRKTFHLLNDGKELETYLTKFFEMPVSIAHNVDGQLMDMPVSSGVTMVSEESLQSLQHDMPSYSLDNLRLRFRANLEIRGVDAYWEEQLFGMPGMGVGFLIGDVTMIGISPRGRCNVPPRDPLTGVTDKTFIKAMMKSRAASLPSESKLLRHGNLYQLTVNTYIPEIEKGKMIKVGDEVRITGPVDLNEG